ncbi:MAG: NADH-quinone oxidoreductase subunit L [Candidatus Pacebacteria bacterium]|nr:NADH-quinone oxidoreductase subunit L [Candidatus Paceibacterota bacterium]
MFALILALPLLGALIAGLFGRWIGARGAEIVTSAGVIGAFAIGVKLFMTLMAGDELQPIILFQWILSDNFTAAWSLRLDMLTAVMVLVVTGVSSCVHIYSIGYMSHDPHRQRFMAYLSLFTFAMLMLVTANDFIQLFFGWEGVGLASYLLIGFWHQKDSANAAAIKAFVVNRVGDFGFALGIFGVFWLFGSVNFDVVFAAAPAKVAEVYRIFGIDWPVMTVICLLLFVGAMGKSAQIGLHTWLPDAMEGPTPVSALIHAATMVTAGVFMLARLSPLFELSEAASLFVALIGGATALFAATVALTQFDIKRVIAYSTCSQLGYMVFAAGVSAYDASMFHLVTHAAFKALLFLGAGSVIHALANEQDMRKMGGLWRVIPVTYVLMWIGSLALAGVPPFAGYASKHMILNAAFAAGGWIGPLLYCIGVLVAGLTAFYSFRLVFMVFHGKPRADHHSMDHAHESPLVMLVPLFVLAVGAVLLGVVGEAYFIGEERGEFWKHAITVLTLHDTIARAHEGFVPPVLVILPTIVGFVGIVLAFVFYVLRPQWPAQLARMSGGVYRFLLNKWYFDELYDRIFVRPVFWLGRFLWQRGDMGTIDRFGPDGISLASQQISKRAGILQSGYIYHYAFAMLLGLVIIVSWYVFIRVFI